jgi:hypothetical protein
MTRPAIIWPFGSAVVPERGGYQAQLAVEVAEAAASATREE